MMHPEHKMKIKKMLLDSLMGDMDHAESKKLAPKPIAAAVEIEKPGHGHAMNKLAGLDAMHAVDPEEKDESPLMEKSEMAMGKHGQEGEMSDDDLKKLLAAHMG